MAIRILKIQGTREAEREARLARAREWMEQRGWRLVDYSAPAGSAMFERAEGAPRLGWFAASRWLPGPDWFRPRTWLGGRRLSLRRVVLVGAVGVVVLAAFLTLFNFSRTPGTARPGTAAADAGESWRYVSVESLNVRAEPKPGSEIVGVLYQNQRVMVEKSASGWARVVRPQWGFVAAQYLSDHPSR